MNQIVTNPPHDAEPPQTMETLVQRADCQNGKLTIEFEDAAHLLDSINFALKHGTITEFEKSLVHLIRIGLTQAVPFREFCHHDGKIPARPGKISKLRIYPDSRTAPSFVWQENDGMKGGLLWHSPTSSWGIHT